MNRGERVRIKKNSRFYPNRRGIYLRDLTIGKRMWRIIDLKGVGPTGFHDDEFYRLEEPVERNFKEGDRVIINTKGTPYNFLDGKIGVIRYTNCGLNSVVIDGKGYAIFDSELTLYTIKGTMEELFLYANRLFANVRKRKDGSFWIEHKGRTIYSVIHDDKNSFGTWDIYSRISDGIHRERNAESVKRSLRRLKREVQ